MRTSKHESISKFEITILYGGYLAGFMHLDVTRLLAFSLAIYVFKPTSLVRLLWKNQITVAFIPREQHLSSERALLQWNCPYVFHIWSSDVPPTTSFCAFWSNVFIQIALFQRPVTSGGWVGGHELLGVPFKSRYYVNRFPCWLDFYKTIEVCLFWTQP